MRDNWRFPVQSQHFVSLGKFGIRSPTVANILASDDAGELARFGHETAPAVREAVAAARSGRN